MLIHTMAVNTNILCQMTATTISTTPCVNLFVFSVYRDIQKCAHTSSDTLGSETHTQTKACVYVYWHEHTACDVRIHLQNDPLQTSIEWCARKTMFNLELTPTACRKSACMSKCVTSYTSTTTQSITNTQMNHWTERFVVKYSNQMLYL